MKDFTFQIYGKVSIQTKKKKKPYYTDGVDFHLCRDCVCVCEFGRVCVSDQKPEEKGLFLERKDLCIWRSLGQETWQVCIFGIPARGHIQTKGFPALILSRLCQLTALSAVS